MKNIYTILLLNSLLACISSFGQTGGSSCANATLINLPDSAYPYYKDSGWVSYNNITQPSPAWFKFVIPAGKPDTLIIAGSANGICLGGGNVRLAVAVYKNNCNVSQDSVLLHYCYNTSPMGFPNWNDMHGKVYLSNTTPGDTFYLAFSGSTYSGFSFRLRWQSSYPKNTICSLADSIVGPVTYGTNHGPWDSSGLYPSNETSRPPCAGYFAGFLSITAVYHPAYFTITPTTDSFTINVEPIACDEPPGINIAAFTDCAHTGNYTTDTSGRYLYFFGCSDTFGITVKNAPIGVPMVIRIDFNRTIAGDFNLSSGNACTFKLTGQGYLMPIELVSFMGKLNRLLNKVALHWQTSNAEAGSQFILERSVDGSHFYTIATIKSSTGKEYNYTDEDYLKYGILYYRLKVRNKDGHFIYSRIVIIDLRSSESVALFPNPSSGVVFLTVPADYNDKVLVMLISAEGKSVLTTSYNVVPGNNTISINTKDLQKGNFFLKVKRQMTGSVSIHKLLLQ